jgi:hypothetical protein
VLHAQFDQPPLWRMEVVLVDVLFVHARGS